MRVEDAVASEVIGGAGYQRAGILQLPRPPRQPRTLRRLLRPGVRGESVPLGTSPRPNGSPLPLPPRLNQTNYVKKTL